MKKLVKESLNDTFRSDNPWAQRFIDENGLGSGMEDIEFDDLAGFIDDNWAEITGLSNRDKDEEGGFPSEVEAILDDLGVDYSDFSDAWAMQREGAEDWEYDDDDEEVELCSNCEEEVVYQEDLCLDCFNEYEDEIRSDEEYDDDDEMDAVDREYDD